MLFLVINGTYECTKDTKYAFVKCCNSQLYFLLCSSRIHFQDHIAQDITLQKVIKFYKLESNGQNRLVMEKAMKKVKTITMHYIN